jgi:hypothetical protein
VESGGHAFASVVTHFPAAVGPAVPGGHVADVDDIMHAFFTSSYTVPGEHAGVDIVVTHSPLALYD